MQDKIERHFAGNLADKTIAIWGLAFKPGTDDIREAPALDLIDRLLELGARVRVYDPEAMDNIRSAYGDKLTCCRHPMEAPAGADALAIITEWQDFRNPDFDQLKRSLKSPVVFDGRNLYKPEQMAALGFTYHSIGRLTVG